jgi:hypothetical protein
MDEKTTVTANKDNDLLFRESLKKKDDENKEMKESKEQPEKLEYFTE